MTIREYLQKKYSESTLSGNLGNIKRFTDYYQDHAPAATYTDVLRYIEHLRKNYDLHPKTLRHQLYAVRIYFNYLLEIGKRKDHPCSELYLKDKISRTIQVDTLYSPEALERFFESYQAILTKKKHLESRNKVVISLLIYQALTVREIAALDVGDVNLDTCHIHIKGNGHQRSRTLPLQARQVLLLYNYLEKDRGGLLKRPDETALLLNQYGERVMAHSISRMINEGRPGSEQLQPIKIRQSVIANLLKKENDIRVVQVFAGHKKAGTTAQYSQDELQALQSAINQYHPLR